MKIDVISSVPEAKAVFSELLSEPEKIFSMIQFDFRSVAERTLSDLLKVELTQHLGRERHQRHGVVAIDKKNYRNGSYKRNFAVKNIGNLEINVPRDRNGEFESKLIRKYERYDSAIEKDICLMFLSGLSTRSIALLSNTILGRSISAGEVSNINEKLLTGIDAWRQRDLSQMKIKFMYVDGVFFKMRVGHKIERVPMLVVIGVTEKDQKVFLAIQQGDKESASTWRQIFKDMKSRGLDKTTVELGIMDGLSGLMTVFRDEFPSAKIQRCQVHVARNVLSKVPHGKKKEVADSLRDIFYAGTRDKAKEAFQMFYADYNDVLPSATKSLANVIDECLTFFSFPQEYWLALRTSNCIERVNKEFKRRTKPMEVLAGEKSTYRLLCFIAAKMEMGWKCMPVSRAPTLPSIKEFTQLN